MSGVPQRDRLTEDLFFPQVKELLISLTGMAYYQDRDETLAGILETRFADLSLTNCLSYLEFLRIGGGEKERRLVSGLMTIGETYFFRNQEHFEALRQVIFPEVIRQQSDERRIHIWCAGCATGAEPYSLSILLRREFEHELRGWDIRIFGTDINEQFLKQAREGHYGEWAFRTTPEAIKDLCFLRADGIRTIAPEYRNAVSFEYHNLAAGPFPPISAGLRAFHIILCRNVLIYFNREAASEIIEQFNRSLAPSGWLVVGPAETDLQAFHSFEQVTHGDTLLYRRVAENAALPTDVASAPMPRHTPVCENRSSQPDTHPELDRMRALADRGEWENAARLSDRVLKEDTANPLMCLYCALVHEQMGKSDEAKRLLRQAIYLDWNFVLAHYYLGLALSKENRDEQAARHLRVVQELLAGRAEGQLIDEYHGMTVLDLNRLTEIQLEVLKA